MNSVLEMMKSLKVDCIGSGPEGKQLDVYYCANSDPNLMKYCLKQGILRCGQCGLVGYCSVACQKEHWKEHKKVCRHSQFRSGTWQPSWSAENRLPQFVKLVSAQVTCGLGFHLWGNTPAFDLIGWERNEFKDNSDWQQPMNIAFAASGDFRSMVETLASVPDTYEGQMTVVLNDMNSVIVARNLLMLGLLMFKGEEAIDTVIAIWYSAAMTKHQYGYACSFIIDHLWPLYESDSKQGVLEHQCSTIELNELDKALTRIFHMINNDWDLQGAVDARNSVMLNPSRKDYMDRRLVGLKDYHRESYNHFHTHGQLLPFDGLVSDHNVPNNFLFLAEHGWLLNDSSDPNQGWSMLEVMKFGDEKNLPTNDLYGRLFYYIKDRLSKMIATIRRIPVKFRLFQVDSQDLATDFQREGIKFDRIDVSNISDKDYVGIDDVLNGWGPLLNKSNQNSSIVTLFLNWYLLYTGTGDPDMKKMTAEMRPKVMKLLELEVLGDRRVNSPPKLVLVPNAILALTDHSEEFEKYMKKNLKNKPGYLKRRLNHKIVPHKVMYLIEANGEAAIDSLSESDQYFVFNCSTNHATRYVEWEMT